jgi:uncharacterized protein YndB with AHSA1/START domain
MSHPSIILAIVNPNKLVRGGFMATQYTLDLNVPIETAFEYVDDPNKMKLWLDGVEETIYLDERDEKNPVGTRFKQRIREGGRVEEYDGQVTAYDKPNHLGIQIGNRSFTTRVDYRFAPTATGTRLNYTSEYEFANWPMRLFGVLFGWFGNRILDKQMKKLKAVAEANVQAGAR